MTLQTLRVPEGSHLVPRIMVFGLGGAGCNAVNNLIARDLNNIEFVVANTDSQSLSASVAENRIQLGINTTEGLGAGADPQKGRAAAEESLEEIREVVDGVHLCFVTAGMGGGTGTGASPVVARVAREAGVLTVAVVIKPFLFEGDIRMAVANAGIADLENEVNTLIVIPNQNLFEISTEATTSKEALAMANDVLYEAVRTITDLMSHTGQINRDFADVRSVFSSNGRAMFGFGEAEGEHRGTTAAEQAMNNRLLEDTVMNHCDRVLLNVIGGSDMKLWDIYDAAEAVHNKVGKDKNIIVGSASDSEFDGRIRVSVIATGLGTSDKNVTRGDLYYDSGFSNANSDSNGSAHSINEHKNGSDYVNAGHETTSDTDQQFVDQWSDNSVEEVTTYNTARTEANDVYSRNTSEPDVTKVEDMSQRSFIAPRNPNKGPEAEKIMAKRHDTKESKTGSYRNTFGSNVRQLLDNLRNEDVQPRRGMESKTRFGKNDISEPLNGAGHSSIHKLN